MAKVLCFKLITMKMNNCDWQESEFNVKLMNIILEAVTEEDIETLHPPNPEKEP